MTPTSSFFVEHPISKDGKKIIYMEPGVLYTMSGEAAPDGLLRPSIEELAQCVEEYLATGKAAKPTNSPD